MTLGKMWQVIFVCYVLYIFVLGTNLQTPNVKFYFGENKFLNQQSWKELFPIPARILVFFSDLAKYVFIICFSCNDPNLRMNLLSLLLLY